ncbi:UNKNOWN [Stylonychia lemnae]|uniref:TRAF-type domain-containing protein n=1 Tax=Stylonychia lemnae TaxID=5949 RepID=A0A078APN0_STYLE|nr:UNKNOWN [Stylonychia lemnae]|eukprot:CDW82873.1 UNKNOWN [Stylonychia lemnae]
MASIEFRHPYLLFIKQHPILDDPNDRRLNYKEQDQYTCCICYQAVSDPRQCSKCNIIFCSFCKIEMAQFLLGCPNHACSDSSYKRPSLDYLNRYKKLVVRCQNIECDKQFPIENEKQYIDHFRRCEYTPKMCQHCNQFPIRQKLLQQHHEKECRMIPRTYSSRVGGQQTYPIPRAKYKKNIGATTQASPMIDPLIPARSTFAMKKQMPFSYPAELTENSMDYQIYEMLPQEISNINLVINSISEQRPTNREIKEHKEHLLMIQSQLHTQLTLLYERQLKAVNQLCFGVVGNEINIINKIDISSFITNIRSTNKSKNQTVNKSFTNLTKWNKIVMEVDSIKIYNKKLNFIGIRVVIPREVAPDNHNIYYARPFKVIDSSSQKETFILLFRDDASTKDKKFTLSLCEFNKNGKYLRDVGTSYTFMIEQLPEGRIGEKQVLIYPQKSPQQSNIQIRKIAKLSYEEDSVDIQEKRNQHTIAKLNLKIQFIKDEETKISELISSLNQKLEEVQDAIENLQIYEHPIIDNSVEVYQQLYLNQSSSQQTLGGQSKQTSSGQPNDETKSGRRTRNLDATSQGSSNHTNLRIDTVARQDTQATSGPNTFEKNRRPQIQFVGVYDSPAQIFDENENSPKSLEQYNQDNMLKNKMSLTSKKVVKVHHRQISNTTYKKTQKNIDEANLLNQSRETVVPRYIGFSQESNQKLGLHVKNNSSQEAGFYVAQHDLKSNKFGDLPIF